MASSSERSNPRTIRQQTRNVRRSPCCPAMAGSTWRRNARARSTRSAAWDGRCALGTFAGTWHGAVGQVARDEHVSPVEVLDADTNRWLSFVIQESRQPGGLRARCCGTIRRELARQLLLELLNSVKARYLVRATARAAGRETNAARTTAAEDPVAWTSAASSPGPSRSSSRNRCRTWATASRARDRPGRYAFTLTYTFQPCAFM